MSEYSGMRDSARIAALLAAILLMLAEQPGTFRRRSVGLEAKIALAVPCRADLIPGEIVRVLRPGVVRLNSEDLTLDQLDVRLEEIFRHRTQRVVFVAGREDLSVRDVLAVIDVALRRADYVSLLTPNVERALTKPGNCLDANIRFPRVMM